MERRVLGSTLQRGSFGLAVLVALAAPVWAVDGVVDINQARALAGGVTPGDTAGFPVTISQSGSYRLTGNLDVTVAADPKNTTAISVTAKDVTIDLNGFMISGLTVCSGAPLACTPTGTGRGVTPAVFNTGITIVVMNGTVRGMGADGIAGATQVEKVKAFSNGGTGIAGSMVTGCVASGNGVGGIRSGSVTNSTAFSNGGVGIGGDLVINCTAQFNGGDGLSVGGAAIGNRSVGNSGFGIQFAGNGLAYSNNILQQNTGGNVSGGVQVQMGGNVCDLALCP
jgi:hypothetical protein